MREIIRITLSLTLSCLIAAAVMGSIFVLTAESKKRNEERNRRQTMLALLGYNKVKPAPETLEFHRIYRYVLGSGPDTRMGYLIPVEGEGEIVCALLILRLNGSFLDIRRTGISPRAAMEDEDRESALRKVLEPAFTFAFADRVIIACIDSRRVAYLVPGEFPGFKSLIGVILALDTRFRILGLEVTEDEEDPGLGAEIAEPYFEEQFEGLAYDIIGRLHVVKKPLPKPYRRYLEATKEEREKQFSGEEIRHIREQYQDETIHAITGATISSRAVTEGVKGMVRKFVYRMKMLDKVVKDEDIPAVF